MNKPDIENEIKKLDHTEIEKYLEGEIMDYYCINGNSVKLLRYDHNEIGEWSFQINFFPFYDSTFE